MSLHVGMASVWKDTRASVGWAQSQNRDSETVSIRGGSRDEACSFDFKRNPPVANTHPRRQTRDLAEHKEETRISEAEGME
jgi:hypothetical protein